MRNLTLACALVVSCLIVGVLGYHYLDDQAWNDALFKAALLQAGVAPVPSGLLVTWWGKLFGWVYAFYSGLVLLATAGLLLAPILRYFTAQAQPQDATDS